MSTLPRKPRRGTEQALADSEARYRLLADNISDVIVRYDTAAIIQYISPSIGQFGYAPAEMLGRSIREFVAPEDIPVGARARLQGDTPLPSGRDNEYRIRHKDGRLIWCEGNPSVIRDADGAPTGIVTVVRDISERRALEEELRRKRDEAEQSATGLRLAVEAGRMAVWRSDIATGLVHGPELKAIFGYPADYPLTAEEMRGRYLPGELERTRAITSAAYARGERIVEVELRLRRLDGELRWLLMRGELVLNREGQPRAGVGVAMDITDRKEAEERVKLLAREVDHRANNLLAIVQSVVQLSKAPTQDDLRRVLIGRVTALGRAHQLLSEAHWKGADLRRLVEEELLAFSLGEAERVSIRGKDVALSPPAAQGLAMALHELATNATKYGALSTPTGQVNVSWARASTGALTIRWAETGGPPVAPPTRQGLGAVMLSRALAGGLKGETKFDWRPEGLVCELSLPGENVADPVSG